MPSRSWDLDISTRPLLDIDRNYTSISPRDDHEDGRFKEITVDYKKYSPLQANLGSVQNRKWNSMRHPWLRNYVCTCGEHKFPQMSAYRHRIRHDLDPMDVDFSGSPYGTSSRMRSYSTTDRWSTLHRDNCLLGGRSITDFNTLRRKWSLKAIHDRFYGMTADCKKPLLLDRKSSYVTSEELADERTEGLINDSEDGDEGGSNYKSALSVSVSVERIFDCETAHGSSADEKDLDEPDSPGVSKSEDEEEVEKEANPGCEITTRLFFVFCVLLFLIASIASTGVYEFYSDLQRLDIVVNEEF